jgi:hypothetical protein
LDCLTFHSARPGRQDEDDNGSGDGIIVHSEVLLIVLPEALTVMAKQQSLSALRNHGELRRCLQLEHQEDVWYALTIRGYQANGHFADITYIRRPYADSEYLPELIAVLATVAGHPPQDAAADFSTASVHVMPADSWKRDPRRLIAELGFGRSASIAQEGPR